MASSALGAPGAPDGPGDPAVLSGSGEQASPGVVRFANALHLARVNSTNTYLRDQALAGAPEGTAVVADEQLEGRGRRGRSWHAPPGSSLLCSVLFRPRFAPSQLHLLPSIVGLAALDALRALAGLEASLKWPNDIVVGRAKLAGILAEVLDGGAAVVVGIGVNIAWPPGWSPPGLAATSGGDGANRAPSETGATTIELCTGRIVATSALATELLEGIGERYHRLATAGGRAEAVAEYRRRCDTIGREVRVELVDTFVEGRAIGVGPDGRLELELRDGSRVLFTAGDVVHLRRAARTRGPGAAD